MALGTWILALAMWTPLTADNAQLQGRMQQISDQPVIVLDVAHNPHSAEYFAQQVTQSMQEKIYTL